MGKLGKISTIKKDYNNSGLQTMQGGLAQKGLTRVPGTGVFKYPYKEIDGKYRTGLDPNAAYIRRISDPLEREMEIERVTKLKERLEADLVISILVHVLLSGTMVFPPLMTTCSMCSLLS